MSDPYRQDIAEFGVFLRSIRSIDEFYERKRPAFRDCRVREMMHEAIKQGFISEESVLLALKQAEKKRYVRHCGMEMTNQRIIGRYSASNSRAAGIDYHSLNPPQCLPARPPASRNSLRLLRALSWLSLNDPMESVGSGGIMSGGDSPGEWAKSLGR